MKPLCAVFSSSPILGSGPLCRRGDHAPLRERVPAIAEARISYTVCNDSQKRSVPSLVAILFSGIGKSQVCFLAGPHIGPFGMRTQQTAPSFGSYAPESRLY